MRGRWLVLVRAAWLVIVLFNLALFIASLPTSYERTLHGAFLSDPVVRRNLHDAGIAVSTYALLQAVPILFAALISTGSLPLAC